MKRLLGGPHTLWLLGALVLAGCTQAAVLRGRIDAARRSLDASERAGAMRCAARELGVGRAHVQAAAADLEDGDLSRSGEEADHAELVAASAARAVRGPACGDAVQTPPVVDANADRDGDGVADVADRCPDEPETFNDVQDADGCPDEADFDGDGIRDRADLCPFDAEDRDGQQDTDGCPDPDHDADGIVDGQDRCPDAVEDHDGTQDEDGCPDPDNDQDGVLDTADLCPAEPGGADTRGCPPVFEHLQVTDHGVRFRVEFDTNRATLRRGAADTLDEVVRYLRQPQNAHLRYEVGGHTDARGAARRNLTLSGARARTVREYLVRAGIEAARLTTRGYGQTVPIDSNRTDAGRQANRRVELNEIDASGALVR